MSKLAILKKGLTRVSLFISLLLMGGLLLGWLGWSVRFSVARSLIEKTLRQQGITDCRFNLNELSPWRLVVTDLVWRAQDTRLLAIERAEIQFKPTGLAARHLDAITLSGAHAAVLSTDTGLSVPVWQEIQNILAQHRGAPETAATPWSVGTLRLQAGQVQLMAATQVVGRCALSWNAVHEEALNYRLWNTLEVMMAPEANATAWQPVLKIRSNGRVDFESGAWNLRPQITLPNLVEAAQALQWWPGELSLPEAIPPHALGLEGELVAQAWTNVVQAQLSVELERNTRLNLPGEGRWIQFQSLRAELQGVPDDFSVRLNGGVSDLSLQEGDENPAGRGRIMSLRGNARVQHAHDQRRVSAAVESDLPSKTMGLLLGKVLPVVPLLFSDGGKLQVVSELATDAAGAWQGKLAYNAEAARSVLSFKDGYVGARHLSVTGTLAVAASQIGATTLAVLLDQGYYIQGQRSYRGSARLELQAMPPFATTQGTLVGSLIPGDLGPWLELSKGAVPFTAQVQGFDLRAEPRWHLDLALPPLTLGRHEDGLQLAGVLTSRAQLAYGATGLEANGVVQVHDARLVAEAGVEARLERLGVDFNVVSGSTHAAGVHFTCAATNLTAQVADLVALRGGALTVPLRWSAERGIECLAGAHVAWQELALDAIQLKVQEFGVRGTAEALEASLSLAVSDTAITPNLRMRMPWMEPAGTTLRLEVPECELVEEDALAQWLAAKGGQMRVSGRWQAQADLRFLGKRPITQGRVALRDGHLVGENYEFSAIKGEIPFMHGVMFRSTEKPFVTFESAKVGDLAFNHGRCDFQLTTRALRIERVEVGWCKGKLNAYAMEWDFKNPEDDFVVYMDRVDLGEALTSLLPLEGEVEGVLYGRLPLGFKGKHLTLAPGFMYSLPGQGGKLQMQDHRQVLTWLNRSGISGEMEVPLAKALSDMNFDMLRFELEPEGDGEGILRIKVGGKSNHKEWPAPVDLTLNFRGPLEKILNMGLDFSRK